MFRFILSCYTRALIISIPRPTSFVGFILLDDDVLRYSVCEFVMILFDEQQWYFGIGAQY